jgi:hypothetical protein
MNEMQRLMLLGPAFLATLVYGSPALAEEPTEPESTATAPAGTGEGGETGQADQAPADRADETETGREASGPSDQADLGDETGDDEYGFRIPQQLPRELPTPSVEETSITMSKDERDALRVVSEFWVRNWPKNFSGPYKPPTVLGPYDPASSDQPMCGGKPLGAENAAYCRDGDFIAWDKDFIAGIPSKEGNTFPYLAIAHEWGHAIQARKPKWEWRARELQADCLAGAALFGARDEGRLEWERQDPEKLGAALRRIAEAEPWTGEPAHHGSGRERVADFFRGEQGVQACAPELP